MDNKIMELAVALGNAIKEDERIKKMNEAKKAFDESTEVQNLMFEYNAQNVALTEEYKKSEVDNDLIAAINDRIGQLYDAIVSHPVYLEYTATQEEVNKFMNEVNGEITFTITGERPCTHDCSSCHADCGHNH